MSGKAKNKISPLKGAVMRVIRAAKSAESRAGDLEALGTRLQTFSQAQFEHFQELPENDPLRQYPIATTVTQLNNDLEVIERAITQRQETTNQVFRNTVAFADTLVEVALEPAQKWFPQRVTGITYIHKEPMVRVIPYAPVALVGIPYSCLAAFETAPPPPDDSWSIWQDFVSIPHEVGHYVFRHARIPNQPQDEPLSVTLWKILKAHSFSSNPDPRRWLEEIFADIYGCVLGGPIVAIDFQDLQLNRSFSEFLTDDATHPIPYFRPIVYQKILDDYFRERYHKPMRERWAKKLAERPYVPRIFVGDSIYRMDEARITGDLVALVETITQVLRAKIGSTEKLDVFYTMNRDEILWPVKSAATNPSDEIELPDGAKVTPESNIEKWAYGKLAQLFEDLKSKPFGQSDTSAQFSPSITEEEVRALQQRFRDDAAQARAAGMVFEPTMSGLTADQVATLWAGGWNTEGPNTYWP